MKSQSDKEISSWRRIRIFLYLLIFVSCFINSMLKPHLGLSNSPFVLDWKKIFYPIIGFPVILPPLIWAQANASYALKKWTIPNIDTNFINFRDPLHFFHAASHVYSFGGIAIIIASFLNHMSDIRNGLYALAVGVGLIIGVKLCIIVCRKKYQP